VVEEQRFPFTAGVFAGAGEACRDHLSIVQNEKITGLQQRRQIAEVAVRDGSGDSIDRQQTRCIARGGGLLGDEVFGEIVIEEEGH